MWRTTGDVKWRELGYTIFKALEKHTRTEFGYSTVQEIHGRVYKLDDMPRYIVLLFTLLFFFFFP